MFYNIKVVYKIIYKSKTFEITELQKKNKKMLEKIKKSIDKIKKQV